jgi:hypothetical protein
MKIKTILLVITIILSLFLNGCSTLKAWGKRGSERVACNNGEGKRVFPVNNVTTLVERYKTINVPNGNEQCRCRTDHLGRERCNCTVETDAIQIPYQKQITKDLNKDKRRDFCESWAINSCITKYGNPDCEENPQIQQQRIKTDKTDNSINCKEYEMYNYNSKPWDCR